MLYKNCDAYLFGSPVLSLGRLYDNPKKDIWTIKVALYFMVGGNVPFDSVVSKELRRQVVTDVYPDHQGVSEEMGDPNSFLMTVNPRYRPQSQA